MKAILESAHTGGSDLLPLEESGVGAALFGEFLRTVGGGGTGDGAAWMASQSRTFPPQACVLTKPAAATIAAADRAVVPNPADSACHLPPSPD